MQPSAASDSKITWLDLALLTFFSADPDALMRFRRAALDMGINLRERPLSHFSSATQVFRSLIRM
jgi:hypothetical protein